MGYNVTLSKTYVERDGPAVIRKQTVRVKHIEYHEDIVVIEGKGVERLHAELADLGQLNYDNTKIRFHPSHDMLSLESVEYTNEPVETDPAIMRI